MQQLPYLHDLSRSKPQIDHVDTMNRAREPFSIIMEEHEQPGMKKLDLHQNKSEQLHQYQDIN